MKICITCGTEYMGIECPKCGCVLFKTLKDMQQSKETVNHPLHYNKGKIEVIDFIEDQQLNFNLGNVIKYICRSDSKGNQLEDLKKARFYVDREIGRLEDTK